MKSIKEKAEEHAPYTREDSWNRTQKCIIAQTSFEAGANYVLEEIERIVNSAIENKSMTIPTWRLNFIIKQLKK